MSDNLCRQALSTRGFSFTRIMFHAFCLLRRPDRGAFFLAGMRREFAFQPDSSHFLRRRAVEGLQLPEMQRPRTQPAVINSRFILKAQPSFPWRARGVPSQQIRE
jgi:hypothetical protein